MGGTDYQKVGRYRVFFTFRNTATEADGISTLLRKNTRYIHHIDLPSVSAVGGIEDYLSAVRGAFGVQVASPFPLVRFGFMKIAEGDLSACWFMEEVEFLQPSGSLRIGIIEYPFIS